MRFSLSCILILGLFVTSVEGQDLGNIPESESINLKFYDSDIGLPHNNIVAIIQDHQGFVWLGTLNGLTRFDSRNFTTFFNDPNDSSTISNNVIRSLIITRKGTVCVSTSIGFNILDCKTGKFRRYLRKTGVNTTLTENSCYAAAEDRQGNIWIGTWYNRIHCLNIATGKISCYQLDIKTSSETIQTLYVDDNNNIWVGTRGGLFVFNQKTKQFTRFYNTESDITLEKDTIFQILQDSKKRIWIAKSHGLDLYYQNKISRVKLTTPEGNNPLERKKVFSIAEDKHGFFWIGTSDGLIVADSEMQNCKVILPHDRNKNGLKNATIRCIYVDNSNDVWICAQDGIYIYNEYVNQFKYAAVIPEKTKWESSYSQTRIYEGNDGEIWVALDGGYYKIHPDNGKLQVVNNERIRRNFPVEISAGNKQDGYFLPALNEQGLFYYNPTSRRVKLYQHSLTNGRSLCGNYVIKTFKDSRGYVWALTNSSGLSRYNAASGDFDNYYQNPKDSSSIPNNWLFDVQEDDNKNVWIATWSGLCKYIPEKNCFRRYLWSNNILVFNITKSDSGFFWLGTSTGLIKFDPLAGKIKKIYTTTDGLAENIVHGVLIDSQKNLWLSSTKGITKFNPQTGEKIHFDVTDGLQDKEFFRNAFLKASDGTMYFGGINGTNYFHPEKIVRGTVEPPIAITDIKILNKPVKSLPEYRELGNVNSAKVLELNYKHYVISIDYVALNFINADKCQYKYKLEGFDHSWNEVGNKHTATYTNLPAGTYTFKVLASNNFGVWNKVPKSIILIIDPPFWLTWWFKGLVTIIVLAILYFSYRFKTFLLTSKKEELEKLVLERTAELKERNEKIIRQSEELQTFAGNLKSANELLLEKQQLVETQKNELMINNEKLSELNSTKDKFFSIIAHDLRNPFNAVQGFSELLLTNFTKYPEEKIQRYLKLIQTSSKNGNYLLENLLQWSRAQTGRINFNPIHLNIEALFMDSEHYFESDILKKRISVEYEMPSDITVFADENMLRTIVRNLISNAVKFTPEGGLIKFHARKTEAYTEIVVEDSGVGISESNQKLLFKVDTNISTKGTASEQGTGLGLVLCREFVQQHQGQIWVESKPGEGSKFVVTLP